MSNLRSQLLSAAAKWLKFVLVQVWGAVIWLNVYLFYSSDGRLIMIKDSRLHFNVKAPVLLKVKYYLL